MKPLSQFWPNKKGSLAQVSFLLPCIDSIHIRCVKLRFLKLLRVMLLGKAVSHWLGYTFVFAVLPNL